MKKKMFSLLLSCLLVLNIFNPIVITDASGGSLNVTSVSITGDGYTEIEGYIDGNVDENELTFLMYVTPPEGTEITYNYLNNDTVAYINQYTIGNNGTFLIRFNINFQKFHDKSLTLIMNAGNREPPYKVSLQPFNPDGIITVDSIRDNAVLYGNDVYTIDNNSHLTPVNVANSIISGGNVIYYKINGMWFNLLDEDAVDNSYLITDNKATDEELQVLTFNKYYTSTGSFKFN